MIEVTFVMNGFKGVVIFSSLLHSGVHKGFWVDQNLMVSKSLDDSIYFITPNMLTQIKKVSEKLEEAVPFGSTGCNVL